MVSKDTCEDEANSVYHPEIHDLSEAMTTEDI